MQNKENLVKAAKALQFTAARQAIVVVGKGSTVISHNFSYYTKLEEQNEFKVHESAAVDSFSRMNVLLAVTEIVMNAEPETFEIEGVSFETHNFIPVFIPDIVFNQLEQSRYWTQKFKAMQSFENSMAQIEGRQARTLNFILDGKKKIASDELMLWEALREEIAKRPYLNIASVKNAHAFFKKDEVRAKMTSAAVSKSWAKLQEMGVSIANFSKEGQFSELTDENFDESFEHLQAPPVENELGEA